MNPENLIPRPKKDPQVVVKAIHKFLEWLAMGKAVKSFAYKDEIDICSWETVVSYMEDKEFLKEHGLESLPEHKAHSKSIGYQIWETECERSAKGENEKSNTASLQMIMRNKYGWDKRKEDSDNSQEKLNALNEFKSLASAMRVSIESKSPSPHEDSDDS